MAYVGTPIDVGNQFSSLVGKRFSGDASTTAFTLDVRANSALDIEVFVENVRQDPNSAYTVDGTTLTFTAAPPSGTNNIYVVHQAPTVASVSPTAGSVTASSFDNSVISGQTELAATPADTDEFLISDAGTIKRIDFSHIKGQGKVAQVVSAVNTTEYATTSSTYSDITGLTLNITPSATSSKILILMQMTNRTNNGSGTNANATVKLLRDSTDIQEMEYFAQLTIGNGNPDSLIHSGSHIYLDSPSTTSQITYKYQGKTNSNFRAFVKNLIAMEILA
jgi:hypothetical protein